MFSCYVLILVVLYFNTLCMMAKAVLVHMTGTTSVRSFLHDIDIVSDDSGGTGAHG